MSNKVSTVLLKRALKKARKMINKYFSPEENLVDKLIAERRNEAKNDKTYAMFDNKPLNYGFLSKTLL